MTAKEKAKSLIEEMYCVEDPMGNYPMCYETAKQCALIAVDEMLNSAGFIWGGRDTETGLSARDSFREYWQEVKTEIEKL
jgi:hypothetical protein